MLQPSYTQIMQKLNAEGESKLTSRYSIVIATAKRARNIIDIIKNDIITKLTYCANADISPR